jgi:hypothetical protein
MILIPISILFAILISCFIIAIYLKNKEFNQVAELYASFIANRPNGHDEFFAKRLPAYLGTNVTHVFKKQLYAVYAYRNGKVFGMMTYFIMQYSSFHIAVQAHRQKKWLEMATHKKLCISQSPRTR